MLKIKIIILSKTITNSVGITKYKTVYQFIRKFVQGLYLWTFAVLRLSVLFYAFP